MSMKDGVVPDNFKQALVNRLIKKQNIGNNELKNCRPIANLSFWSKVLEKQIISMIIFLPSTCQIIYNLHRNYFT